METRVRKFIQPGFYVFFGMSIVLNTHFARVMEEIMYHIYFCILKDSIRTER